MFEELGTYVYLSTLSQTNPTFATKAQEYSTFNSSNAKNISGKTINPIMNALTQLKGMAATQSQLEHQAIQNYMKKLDYYIHDDTCPKPLRDKLKQQQQKLQSYKNLDFNKFNSDQTEFINAINIIQQDLDVYKKRLKELTMPTSSRLAKERLPYNIQTRVEKFFLNQDKKKQRRKNVRRDRALKDEIEKVIKNNLSNFPPQLSQELIALIFIDFNNWLDTQSDQSYNKISEEEIIELFNQYTFNEGQAGKETHVQKLLRTQTQEIEVLLTDIQHNIHGMYLSEDEYNKLNKFVQEAKADKEKGPKSISIQSKTYSKRQAEALIKTYNANLDQQESSRFAFTFHTATSHGNFYELVNTIIAAGANVSANAGADLIIPIGSIVFGERETQNQQRLLHLSRDLGNLISDDFNKQQTITIENFNEQVEKQRNLSNSLQQSISNREKTLTKMNELGEQFFIAHESLKLYRQSEEINSEFEEFHGRKMNILSALTKLYASPILADNMVNSNMLMTYLINISDATLAHNHDPLETYLSLFAGLLMFDDIKSIAEVSVNTINNNLINESATINTLHVYNVDGVYYPISIILTNLITQMESVASSMNSLTSQSTAIAVINGPTPTEPDNHSEEAWAALANSTIQDTTIQIHFLAGFTNTISKLFNAF